VPSSYLIKVVARLDDPALAARVANAFAQEGIQLARQASRGDVGSAELEMKTMLDAATERLHQAEQRYDEFRKVAQIELVRKEVETLLLQRTDFMKTVVELETERAKLARAEQELASRNRVNVVHESIDRSPAFEAARAASTRPAC
jgi:uncharacterized protein involved in exopolysaccharide biosynthesis